MFKYFCITCEYFFCDYWPQSHNCGMKSGFVKLNYYVQNYEGKGNGLRICNFLEYVVCCHGKTLTRTVIFP
jgi:hypothetical protein